MSIGLALLAAGASTRLGHPKQLLSFRGRPLLRHLCEIADAAAPFDPLVVILGSSAARIRREAGPLPATFIVNKNWRDGMGSSIRCGVRACRSCEALVIMLCDQPFVTPTLLRRLVSIYRKNPGGIIACRYGQTPGPPALFDASYFPSLLALPLNAGAKSVILNNLAAVRFVPFPKGAADIDTPSDWQKIAKNQPCLPLRRRYNTGA